MSVGTWGYGTGATSAAAHPFSLCIQGVDVIGSVPIESIRVNASVSSNASLTFTIRDPTGMMAIPAKWTDVLFTDHTEGEVIFGGVVIGGGVTERGPTGVSLAIRCVDYGILLDVAPLMDSVTLATNTNRPLADILQSIAAVTPLAAVTALPSTEGGKLHKATFFGVPMPYADETVASGQMARAALDQYADRAITGGTDRPWAATPAAVWVSPLRELAAYPGTATTGAAPLEVRQNPTTSGHVSADSIDIDLDYRTVEAGVYVADSDTTYGGDNSGWHRGTVNGYTVIPSSISRRMFVSAEPEMYGEEYVAARRDGTISGEAVVTAAKNFVPGTALTVYYPILGLDGTYAIAGVATSFLKSAAGLRVSTIQFSGSATSSSGERGTVARFNRTRFARAGVRN